METMPQLIDAGQTINYEVQIPFKPSFPNLVFQILKMGILVGGFTNVIDFFKINGIRKHEKVGLATLHIEGKTLAWF